MIDFSHENSTYFPTLGLRPSEMRALEELPENTKDRIRPIILFAPWVSSKHLKKSWERLEGAIGPRPFYLDLDGTYDAQSNSRPAGQEFRELFDHQNGVRRYFDLVREIPPAIPVLRTDVTFAGSLEEQLGLINELGRGFLVRITKTSFGSGDVGGLISVLQGTGLSNFVISVDAEWSADVIDCEAWISRVIDKITAANISVPIITSMSSFPKTFSDIDGVRVLPMLSRELFNNIRRRYSNELQIFYGDWGTTKPRSKSGGRNPPPRIDYVGNGNWVIYRKKDSWGYLEAAEQLINSDFWNGDLHIWGSLMIEKTAAGDVSGITTPAKNVAARVNLHLHQQAWFDEPNAMLDTDDPWDDDL